jgi:hypothetical protein
MLCLQEEALRGKYTQESFQLQTWQDSGCDRVPHESDKDRKNKLSYRNHNIVPYSVSILFQEFKWNIKSCMNEAYGKNFFIINIQPESYAEEDHWHFQGGDPPHPKRNTVTFVVHT